METHKTSEAPIENIPLPAASIETLAPEVPPATEATVTEHVATVVPFSIETPQGEVANIEVNITTLASADNNFSVLNSTNNFYIRC